MIQHKLKDIGKALNRETPTVYNWSKKFLVIPIVNEIKSRTPTGKKMNINQVNATLLSMISSLLEEGFSTAWVGRNLLDTFKIISRNQESILELRRMSLLVNKDYIVLSSGDCRAIKSKKECKIFYFEDAFKKIEDVGFEDF